MSRPTVVAALAINCLASHPLIAQTPARLDEMQPGARVRVTAPGIVAGRYVGTVLSRSADTLTVGRANERPVAVPTARLTSLEVSGGRSRKLGAIRGALWGAPVGTVIAILEHTEREYCGSPGCALQNDYVLVRRPPNALEVAWGAFAGAGMGALIGAWIGREAWTRSDLAPRVAIGVAPRGAVTAGLAIAVR
jgi:hypothetical protein